VERRERKPASPFVSAMAAPLEYVCRCHENAESFDSRGNALRASFLLELMKFHRHQSAVCACPRDPRDPREREREREREEFGSFRRRSTDVFGEDHPISRARPSDPLLGRDGDDP